MKQKITIICTLLILVGYIIIGYNNQTIGYLQTDNAQYVPDTVWVKAVLDENEAEDKKRMEFEIPWQSGTMEGVQGTAPIVYSIHSIVPHLEATNQFSMIGKGMVELPYNHTIPVGAYTISVQIENEGHTHIKDSVLTVVVY
ncbi:MAG: hypothetical protein LIO65_02120 [Odoribacter sp.]|nr:hypothetical protein [Odoribacter sp.]